MLLNNMQYRKERGNDGVISIYFTYQTRIELPPEQVWEAMEMSLVDAKKSWLWPEEFSEHTQDTLPLREGESFTTQYRMKNPETGEVSEYQYRYQLQRYRPEEKLFEYRAQRGHPFPGGGAVVTITPAEGGATMFNWEGLYQHTGNRAAAESVFSWYFPLFFGRLEKNIKRQEETQAA